MNRFALTCAVALLASLTFVGCGTEAESDCDPNREQCVEEDASADAGVDIEADTGADAVADAGADTGVDVVEDAEVEADAAADTEVEADSEADTSADAEVDAVADSGADAEADVGTDAEPDANSGECTGPTSEAISASMSDGATPDCPSCLGATMPSFTLEDVQPLSCGFGQSYGLDVFDGQTLLVTLLSAGCSFCQNQIGLLEQMQLELGFEGVAVAMVAVNLDSQAERAVLLTERCSFPVLQDTEDDDVWGMYQGRKDDIYIYGADGTLRSFFRSGEGPSLILSSEEGYANVRDALRDAAAGD